MKISRDSRRDGIRHARRVSNWTAAFLLALTGGAAAALARGASHTAVTYSPATGGAVAAGSATSGTSVGGPRVSHSVATTTASGVTVTTTTQTINGKTIVTRVRSGHPRGDD